VECKILAGGCTVVVYLLFNLVQKPGVVAAWRAKKMRPMPGRVSAAATHAQQAMRNKESGKGPFQREDGDKCALRSLRAQNAVRGRPSIGGAR
jgi:hypothetical protein